MEVNVINLIYFTAPWLIISSSTGSHFPFPPLLLSHLTHSTSISFSAIHLRKTKAVQYAASTLAAASAPASSSSDGVDTGREIVKSEASEDAPVKNPLEESIRDVDDAKNALNNCKNEGIALKSKLEKLQEEKRTLFVTLKKVLKRDSERKGWHQ